MQTLQLTLTDEDLARFLAKVDPPDIHGCTLWNAATFDSGYGIFSIKSKTVLAHRVAWTVEFGPIPDGLEIDHVWARGCRSKACVNTAHLDAVTPLENSRRKRAAARWRASIQVRTELEDVS